MSEQFFSWQASLAAGAPISASKTMRAVSMSAFDIGNLKRLLGVVSVQLGGAYRVRGTRAACVV
eukprot:CAMPEP_0202891744 /NCGR_PEP_ID=MMETSP1392-20130828/1729_1 /ASSEMBLY_ACC=CAM_ASM_000868 /TAXON_ID=225041 /ORGANISM="Chlamydomonas chlamydogama, Strain SAG 11-48b" /LENGTH=63 /DNA_ID=CAMNT_0049575591 /DNA_START=268 /DNA_END=459 /DNA_ORIENTATION=+